MLELENSTKAKAWVKYSWAFLFRDEFLYENYKEDMNMEIKEFYKKYNLNKYTFAQLSGVGTESLIKFEEGEQIRQSTIERIEQAMLIIEMGDYVRPRYDNYRGRHSVSYKDEFQRKVHIYMQSVKKIIAIGL